MLDSSPSSSNLPPGIQSGDIVANRYRLEGVVGRGGMAVVVAARHLELDERVAVKFMSPDALSDPEAVSRFDREVKAAARIKSEYVARVYDAGKLADGRRYMVLEFLEGEDLSVRIRRDGPLAPEHAIRFALQACSAVLEAHGLGIIHRDLKPANLRVVRRSDGSEIVKVLDFGVMKRMPGAQGDTEVNETQPGTIVGTPLYTSPEQLRGSNDVDVRADVWSLGATLFELLTGRPPFGGKTYPQVIANVLEAAPIPLRSLREGISESLEGVVLRCLSKQPDARYGDMTEMAQALAETIELDSELRGLLERMSRQLRSQPFNPAPGPVSATSNASARDTPNAQLLENSPRPAAKSLAPVGRSNTKEYQHRPGTRRGLLITSMGAGLTAIVVVAIGLPWLPRFSSPGIAPTTPIRSIQQQREPTRAEIGPARGVTSIDPPVFGAEPLPLSSAPQPVLPAPDVKASPRRQTRSSQSAHIASPARNREPVTSPSSAPSPNTSVRPKNPLLVAPW